MSRKFTRREAAIALSASSALLAQTPAQTPAQPPLPQNADEELRASREQLVQSAQQLAKFDLPMATEPAVHFKA